MDLNLDFMTRTIGVWLAVSLALLGLRLLGVSQHRSADGGLCLFPNLNDIIATTIENRSPDVADNMTKNTAMLMKLRKRKNIRTISGGSSIEEVISFAENTNFQWYSGAEPLSVQPSDVITTATYQYRQAACAVFITGLEKIKNAGKEQMISLIGSRTEVAEQTIINNMSAGVYSDGTGFGGKQLTGLLAAVPNDPTTGTYGNIDRSQWTFWRPQLTTGAGFTNATIQGSFNQLWAKLVRGGDQTDLIVADNNVFIAYLESLQKLAQFVQSEIGDLGFPTLKYQGIDIVMDGGLGGSCPANSAWFLNTKYLFLRPVKGRDIVPLSPDTRVPFNQDASAQIMAWAGQFTLRNSQLQGFFKGF